MPGSVFRQDADTSIVGFPSLGYPTISGITAPTNHYPDAGNGYINVPLHIIQSWVPHSKPKVNQVNTAPILTNTGNVAYGGSQLMYGAKELTRIQIEGTITTPTDSNHQPTLTATNGSWTIQMTYAELIIMCMEGRANLDIFGGWNKIEPAWFRDPFGRYYYSPKVVDFSSSYIEAIPGRTQFQLTLKV